jgi:membrane protein required for beta-lactamase induction
MRAYISTLFWIFIGGLLSHYGYTIETWQFWTASAVLAAVVGLLVYMSEGK